ncbi:MAG: UDP-N-acetylmuramoyl-L-alanine--D-glutamate ligase [Planctomycetota bacterium]|nr:UDP-N-acetylmuramoyl-L-alanine--D-glutamate ligase [Planctomycetota bacterium]
MDTNAANQVPHVRPFSRMPARMDLVGKRVTVMGLGRFGGGVGVARFLVSRGADVLVTDLDPPERLADSLRSIDDHVRAGTISLRLGEHNVSDFTTCDLVIANPAVPKPWENRFLRAASAAGVPVSTEIELLVRGLAAHGDATSATPIIAITGSAGKSTTSNLIAHILSSSGIRTVLGGNIGGSLLDKLDAWTHTPPDVLVLELSSAMLHWLAPWSPTVGVVTNLSPNHLDWHGSLEHYRASKQQILASQRPGDAAVLGPGVHDWPVNTGVDCRRVTEGSGVSGLQLLGRHNALNAAVAVEGVLALADLATRSPARAAPLQAITRASAEHAARSCPALTHRLAPVADVRGVSYVNDSKATTPESTLLALDALRDPRMGLTRIHLIAGGYDKGSDLSPIGCLAPELAGLYTIGKTGPAIDAAAAGKSLPCGDLTTAVATAAKRARPGDCVLLSTACASWDQFINYEQRGEQFAQLVRGL